jgi:RNA polymerase sigma factor for flagellar operon FliA
LGNLERLFLDNLATVEQIVRFVVRRHHLAKDEADELSSSVKLKIIENNYEVLRKFQGRSSLRTYLTSVVQRHFLDDRTARWGKWRPSAAARRLGPTALLLDRLITRDGLTVDEAVETVCARKDASLSREAMHALALKLPQRVRKRFVSDEDLEAYPAVESAGALENEGTGKTRADEIERCLASAMEGLTDEDRLILKLRFQHELQVSRISRLTGLDQKSLYRRLEQMMKRLRHELEARGVTGDEVTSLLGHPAAGFDALFRPEAEVKPPERPSL